LVLEASDRAGGKILTSDFSGRRVDEGPDQFLVRQPEMAQLCTELGLGDSLVSPRTLGASLLVKGQLKRFPPGLLLGVPTDIDALEASGLVSADAIDRLRATERETADGHPSTKTTTPLAAGEDESIASLIGRHLGSEVADRLVSPLLAGVHAGDPERLSARVAAPQIAMAAEHPEGLLAGARNHMAVAAAAAAARPGAGPVFNGLVGGTSEVIDALVAELGGRLVVNTPVDRVTQAPGGGVVVSHSAGTTRARGVVIAAPTGPASKMLADASPAASAGLAGIGYTSVVLVTFALPAASVDHPLDGTGFLIPPDQVDLLKACSWLSRKFAHLAEGDVLARASAGSRLDPKAISLSDDELTDRLFAELTPIMRLSADPSAVRISRWPDGLPQFEPGHLTRVADIRARLRADCPHMTIAGAGLEGLGLPTCVRRGTAAAIELLDRL